MLQQAVLAKGFAALAVLCAVVVWALGPVGQPANHSSAAANASQNTTEKTVIQDSMAARSSAAGAPNASTAIASGAAATPSPSPATAAEAAPALAAPTPAAPPSPAVAGVIAQVAIPLSTPAPTLLPAAASTPAASPTPTPTSTPSPSPAAAPSARQIESDITAKLRNKTIEFESKSDQLTARGKQVLDDLLPVLNQAPQTRFLIEGHTDSWGDKAYNLALSERRARAVKNYLTAQGLEAARFEFTGLGDVRPIADNATTAGSRKNRRIEFKAL
jgi:outer membrane protein OmpA-like peptidoglycan-associated protein